ncbi:UNVERIFIED_ORG: hypothetical protein ABIB52_004433 [Arthrobacter sp. UYCu721]
MTGPLYFDAQNVARDPATTTTGPNYAGYWCIDYHNLAARGQPNQPTSITKDSCASLPSPPGAAALNSVEGPGPSTAAPDQ